MRQGTNHTAIKANNVSAILVATLKHGVTSRAQLAEQIGVSSATMTNLIGELTDAGIIIEDGNISRGMGRPQKALQLVPDARYAIGVHFDVDRVNIGITDLLARSVHQYTINGVQGNAPSSLLSQISETIQDLIQKNNIHSSKIVGIGVAAHGLVDPKTGVNIVAPSMGWQNVPLKATFEEHTGLPVFVDNNIHAMAFYEAMFGEAKHIQTLVFVYVRIGIGAGLFMNGHIYHGAGAGAGELGHTTAQIDGGRPCRCGNNGCLETVFSEPLILELAEQIATENPDSIIASICHEENGITIEAVFRAAQLGDEIITQMLANRARYLGYALANLVNVFNPEMIVLGGILTQEHGIIKKIVQDIIHQHAFSQTGKNVIIQSTKRGPFIGMEGAAALALDHFFYRPTQQHI